MKKLIDRLQQIPEEEQDKYAAVYLQELKDDQRWEELFAQTTDEQWERVIENARTRETGSVRPLTDTIGAGPGLYESPEKVGKEIRNQRDT